MAAFVALPVGVWRCRSQCSRVGGGAVKGGGGRGAEDAKHTAGCVHTQDVDAKVGSLIEAHLEEHATAWNEATIPQRALVLVNDLRAHYVWVSKE